MERVRKTGYALLIVLCLLGVYAPMAAAETAGPPGAAPESGASPARWAYIAAALSVGLACMGAGLAVAHVGAAAVAGVAEKPEMAARALIFVGLAEGIAIYGLIIAIMILGKV